ncbi:BgTH12-02548 [Blumeria graminis f. sp. triticale]|uniref:BgTH12-02548 n=1 Tax=Blumeria graminis f. sp. triticale TaxID=1689686 RepID=A0A9W4GF19_BLUGR|nr:BgTH12-02548 [Blumeria graminis f. sp. triticale]
MMAADHLATHTNITCSC